MTGPFLQSSRQVFCRISLDLGVSGISLIVSLWLQVTGETQEVRGPSHDIMSGPRDINKTSLCCSPGSSVRAVSARCLHQKVPIFCFPMLYSSDETLLPPTHLQKEAGRVAAPAPGGVFQHKLFAILSKIGLFCPHT